jgi:hypothetical protein
VSDRAFKKLLLKSQLLDLEEAEFNELDAQYSQEFSKDFREELSLKPKSGSSAKKKEDAKYEVPSGTLKKLHRKLAMATHPDVSQEKLPFTEVQSAYEGGDASKMLSLAYELGLSIKLSEKEMLALAEQLRAKKKRIETAKSTVRWAWCTSNKSEKLKTEIRRALGVTDDAWSAYLDSEKAD